MSAMPPSRVELSYSPPRNSGQIRASSEETALTMDEVAAAFAAVGPKEFDVRQHLQVQLLKDEPQERGLTLEGNARNSARQ